MLSKLLMLVTAIVVIVHLVTWYPELPDQVPSKFGSDGLAKQYMDKSGFIALMAFVQAISFLSTGGLSFVINKLPTSLINLPYKEYWLEEPRRAESMEVMASSLRWIAIITAWFLLALTHLSFVIGIGKRNSTSPEFEMALAGYLLFVFGFIGWLYWRFRKVA
ncbi:MAG: DUF1648 domain-containing protein [Planctomycetota bacterium]